MLITFVFYAPYELDEDLQFVHESVGEGDQQHLGVKAW
jgi:hypothetical protein